MYLASSMMEGGLKGVKSTYPLKIKKVDGLTTVELTIENQDELIRLITDEQSKQAELKKKLPDIIAECGVSPVDLIDDRTLQLFELWNFYRYSPDKINKEPFYDAVGIFNMTLGQRIG